MRINEGQIKTTNHRKVQACLLAAMSFFARPVHRIGGLCLKLISSSKFYMRGASLHKKLLFVCWFQLIYWT